jgi:uncharacterized protein YecE (DUF72 family)
MANEEPLLRYGTSSFSSKDWIGPFYPAGTKAQDFLRIYAQSFDTVEVDSTYYGIPSPATVDGWAEKTPEHFLFALKFPAAIVHAGKDSRPDPNILLLPEKIYGIRDKFLETAVRLRKRLGPLLLQLPYFSKQEFPGAEPLFERLDRFFSDLPEGFQIAVEIRNRTWFNGVFADLCRRHGAALAPADYMSMPLPDRYGPDFDPVTADFSYVRLIGNRKVIEALTTRWDREVMDRGANLAIWADHLKQMVRRRVKTFIYVNNHYAGFAPGTVRKLQGMVR